MLQTESANFKKSKEGANAASFAGAAEKFRTSTQNRVVAPLYGIVTSGEETQAETLQEHLKKICGVVLPINPSGISASPNQGNAIFVGKTAALSAGRLKAEELDKLAGEQGFMLRATDGVVAVAGNCPAGTGFGIAAYLELQGARFFRPWT